MFFQVQNMKLCLSKSQPNSNRRGKNVDFAYSKFRCLFYKFKFSDSPQF